MGRLGRDSVAAKPLLRVRAGVDLGTRLETDGCIRVESREPLSLGDEVGVEVSFGALTDEVVLEGVVRDLSTGGPSARLATKRSVLVEVAPIDRDRLTYVRAVAEGRRDASARAHRRVPAEDLAVVWRRGRDMSLESPLVDISRGGAFIQAAPVNAMPMVGDRLEVEIPVASERIRVRSIVTWVTDAGVGSGVGSGVGTDAVTDAATDASAAAASGAGVGQRRGFGVEFRIADRAQAATLAKLVRQRESAYIGYGSARLGT